MPMTPFPVIHDSEVLDRIVAADAVALMRTALVNAFTGELVSSVRVSVDAGSTALTFTAGGMRNGVTGFRVYGGWGPSGDQMTPVWGADGRLLGIVTGTVLGALRTGALGGAAVDALARADAKTLGVIGSGRMAWSQVWAACATRRFNRVDVFSPNPDRRRAFAARVEAELDVVTSAVDSAEDATREHDVIIVSTTATVPVVEASWIAPGSHISSTGPKFASGSELGTDLADLVDVLVSDSPQQAAAYPEGWFSPRPIAHLGGVIAGSIPGRCTESDITLYCSTGLAGTEVLLAAQLLLD